MPKHFQTDRALEQQKRIRGSMLDLMAEKTYAEITVSMICSRAGIPRRMFYYYYTGKEDVFDSILREVLEDCDLEVMFSPSPDRQMLERSMVRFFRYWQERRAPELSAILKSDLGDKLVAKWIRLVSSHLDIQRLLDPLSRERQQAGNFLGITCVFYTLFHWQKGGFAYTPEQMAAHVTRILTEPILRDRKPGATFAGDSWFTL